MSKANSKSVAKAPSRARIWCFTINNPDEKDESHLSQEKFLSGIRSMVWQIEEGESKTPHIQGVIQFKNQINFQTVKNKMPKAHLEVCKNFMASKHYCQKDDGRIRGPYIYPEKRKKMSDIDISKYWRKIFSDMLYDERTKEYKKD